jgi:hypothetical protein
MRPSNDKKKPKPSIIDRSLRTENSTEYIPKNEASINAKPQLKLKQNYQKDFRNDVEIPVNDPLSTPKTKQISEL